MRRKWLVTLAVIMSLAVAGIGLAWWTDTLNVSGTVETGNLNVKFTGAEVSDNEPAGTDVGVITANVNNENDKKVDITVTNAYPGYEGTATITITNDGTVPVKVASVGSATGVPSYAEVTTENITVGEQIAPNATKTFNVKVKIIGTDETSENQTFTFSIPIDFVQFNQTNQQ